jgi:hypothetical protein
MTSLTIAEMRLTFFLFSFFFSRRWPMGPHRFYVRYPISVNHPYYYEENWSKDYQYVMAFTADKLEDVTQRYTQK